jgi:hypothetical protein
MKKRKFIIYFDDYCDDEKIDKHYLNNELSKLLMYYNIEITRIEIENMEKEEHEN